jgi:hypothetical protein
MMIRQRPALDGAVLDNDALSAERFGRCEDSEHGDSFKRFRCEGTGGRRRVGITDWAREQYPGKSGCMVEYSRDGSHNGK